MLNFKNFILGTVTCAAGNYGITSDASIIPPEAIELIKLLCTTIGGIVTAILLNILKKKFPQIFGKK